LRIHNDCYVSNWDHKINTLLCIKKISIPYLGGNNRRVIIIGNNKSAQQLNVFFNKRKDLGYKVLGVFSDQLATTVKDSFEFLKEEEVDEIYCSIEEVSDDIINEYVKFSDQNYSLLKFIPNTKRIFSKRLKTDYYEYLPVLSIPEIYWLSFLFFLG